MRVLNKEIPQLTWNRLVGGIKAKKELQYVEDKIVEDILLKELEKNPKLVEFLGGAKPEKAERSEKYKKIVKLVRLVLHQSYGIFQTGSAEKRNKLLNELRNLSSQKRELGPTKALHEELLKTHRSTKERLDVYQELYWKLWEITGKPRRVIDLAAGLNPLSFPWMGLWLVEYLAVEMNQADCDFLNSYFDIVKYYGMKGLAIPVDLREVASKPELLACFPKFNVCLMFKTTDSLEHGKGHRESEAVINAVPADWVIVSFATKTIGGKPMSSARHIWIEKFCERLGYEFKKITMKGEVFYIIKKRL